MGLPRQLRPERAAGRTAIGPSLQLAVRGAFGMFSVPERSPVSACRKAVISAALPFGASQVRVGGTGAVRRRRNVISTPIEVSIRYPREVRQARIECRLDGNGAVVGLR